jgi:hypothetical protein
MRRRSGRVRRNTEGERLVAKFKIATPAGASFTVEGGGYDYEMEALQGMDAEIVEGPTDEDGFIKFAQDADAVYAKGITDHQEDHRWLAGEVSRHRFGVGRG